MALALLYVVEADDTGIRLDLDTGTSPFYRIHLGSEVHRDHGFSLVEPYWSSAVRRNPKAGVHLDTRTNCVLPAEAVERPGTLVQLQAMGHISGRAPTYSHPARLPARSSSRRESAGPHAPRPSMGLDVMTGPGGPGPAQAPARSIGARGAKEVYSRPASVDDVLGAVVELAGPVVAKLLASGGGGAASSSSNWPATLMAALRLLLGLSGPADAAVRMSGPQSSGPRLIWPGHHDIRAANRFSDDAAGSEHRRWAGHRSHADECRWSRPQLFGVDDALIAAVAGPIIGSVVGPLVEALPQLLNAANHARLEERRSARAHVGQQLTEFNRARLLEQLLDARGDGTGGQTPAGPPDTAAPDPALLTELLRLLQPAAAVPVPAGTAAAQSVGSPAPPTPRPEHTAPMPSRAVLAPVLYPAVPGAGEHGIAFVRGRSAVLHFRLETGPHHPVAPLPRAVLRLRLSEPGSATVLLMKEQRLLDLTPGDDIAVVLDEREVETLPADMELEITAGLRWPGRTAVYEATCMHRLVLCSPLRALATGEATDDPHELTDPQQFRSFWNRVWESPAGSTAGDALPLWGIDATLRYSVFVSGVERTNGLMETRFLTPPTDTGSIRATTAGRFRSGLELSMSELNRLLPLWQGRPPVEPQVLSALASPAWLAARAGDAVVHVRFDGRRRSRGTVWVVPIPRLRRFSLVRVIDTAASGQVLEVRTEHVDFPVVEAIRVIGLVSGADSDPEAPPTLEGFMFPGQDVVLNTQVPLEPALPAPARRAPGSAG